MHTSTNLNRTQRLPPITASTFGSSNQKVMRICPLITPREQKVLHLIAYEYSSKEIASKLFISYETVNTHRKNIMMKLDVKNTAGMVRVAYQKNILHSA